MHRNHIKITDEYADDDLLLMDNDTFTCQILCRLLLGMDLCKLFLHYTQNTHYRANVAAVEILNCHSTTSCPYLLSVLIREVPLYSIPLYYS